MLTNDHRFDFRAPIDMLLNKYVSGQPHVCRATNISRGGMLVQKLLEPEAGNAVVGLQFQLPGQDNIITTAGHIVYDHQWLRATGIRFLSLTDEQRKLIEQFIVDQMDWKRALMGEK